MTVAHFTLLHVTVPRRRKDVLTLDYQLDYQSSRKRKMDSWAHQNSALAQHRFKCLVSCLTQEN